VSIRRVAPLAFKFRVSGLGFGVTVPVDRTGGTAALRVKRVDAAAHGRGALVHPCIWCYTDVYLVLYWCIFGVILMHIWCCTGVYLVLYWCIFGVILVYNYKSIITVTAITINATGSGLRYN